MSFFKDYKDDLEQAVNGVDTNSEAAPEDSLFTVSENAEHSDFEDGVDPELLASIMEDESPAKKDEKKNKLFEKKHGKDAEPEVTPEPVKAAAVAEEEHKPQLDFAKADNESVTVITKGTTINGSIVSDCALDVMGTINGDIECLGKLSISGKVRGNSTAAEVYINTERLEGDVTSEGSIKVGVKTVVIGDISAASAVFAGAIKGEIDVKGPVVLDSTAVVKGNIKAKSIQINNGAVLEGFCSLTYADTTIDNIFE